MRIVMDDAGDAPAELLKQYNIYVVPINIMFGTEQFLSEITMTHAEFYEKVQAVTDANFPKTSQPTPHQFEEAYRMILAAGESEILTVTVSNRLSGTYASAVAAIRELEGEGTFHLFDSQAGSAAQGFMALEAARMARDGASAATILAKLEKMRDDMVIMFTIDSLDFARRGGRVSNVKSVMASLLNLKPITEVRDGIIVEAGRVRTRTKAMATIVSGVQQRIANRPVRLAIIHANCGPEADQLLAQAQQALHVTESHITEMAIGVAINLGPGALGIVAIPDE
ncbi:MAG: DegV family protein [Anaerolineae bacterium]|nr:DegV family protein [Anaerolineae bacterium]MCO5187938.1 DegV family protein [Anaerolineae bacterium]MCO5195053.1 DegV family protein [Anaerolineae bacterium]MCO5196415.1 DegV family protein [Anaerolineae bacterium]MCO5207182.1 DegV family protein [Anaerolineae bacterium]